MKDEKSEESGEEKMIKEEKSEEKSEEKMIKEEKEEKSEESEEMKDEKEKEENGEEKENEKNEKSEEMKDEKEKEEKEEEKENEKNEKSEEMKDEKMIMEEEEKITTKENDNETKKEDTIGNDEKGTQQEKSNQDNETKKRDEDERNIDPKDSVHSTSQETSPNPPSQPEPNDSLSSLVSSNKQTRLQATHRVEVARHVLSHHCRHDSLAARRTLDRPAHLFLPHPVLRHRQRETPHVPTSSCPHASTRSDASAPSRPASSSSGAQERSRDSPRRTTSSHRRSGQSRWGGKGITHLRYKVQKTGSDAIAMIGIRYDGRPLCPLRVLRLTNSSRRRNSLPMTILVHRASHSQMVTHIHVC